MSCRARSEYENRIGVELHAGIIAEGLVQLGIEYKRHTSLTHLDMRDARQIFPAVLHPNLVEIDLNQVAAEAAFAADRQIHCGPPNGGLIWDRIIACERGDSGHIPTTIHRGYAPFQNIRSLRDIDKTGCTRSKLTPIIQLYAP